MHKPSHSCTASKEVKYDWRVCHKKNWYWAKTHLHGWTITSDQVGHQGLFLPPLLVPKQSCHENALNVSKYRFGNHIESFSNGGEEASWNPARGGLIYQYTTQVPSLRCMEGRKRAISKKVGRGTVLQEEAKRQAYIGKLSKNKARTFHFPTQFA